VVTLLRNSSSSSSKSDVCIIVIYIYNTKCYCIKSDDVWGTSVCCVKPCNQRVKLKRERLE
jgi:hypothetical protein